ncbi:MAG: hypothetical protein HN757_07290, partial [Calditrichaeota bacterium]|nr:hypothetical protein [Calditrichota bacterium]
MKIRFAFVILLIGVSSWAQERFEPMGSLYNFQNHPSYVQINGDFVYAGGPSSGMSVVDISDRANPLFTEYFDVVGTECVLADSLLFVLSEKEIHIFDVSNPAIPQFVSMIRSYHNNGFSYDNNIAVIFSSGRVLSGQYEGFYAQHFKIADLADVTIPQSFYLETIYLDGGLSPWGYHPVIVNQILYLWDRRDAALGLYDLSDPSQPIE